MEQVTNYGFAVISEKDKGLPFLLMSVGRSNERYVYRPNGIIHHQFLFTISGAGETVINGEKIRVSPNTLMYHEPNTMHKYRRITDSWQVVWLTFEQKWTIFSAKSGVYPMGDMTELTDLCNKLIGIEQNILYEEKATSVLYELLIAVSRRTASLQSADRLAPALNLISKNYCRDISLAELSKACGMTREYFCRLFKKNYHTTAFFYIRNMRIQEAKKRLLLYPERNLEKIAGDVGYNSLNYFLTDFKKIAGVTPTEFKKERF